MLVAFFVPNGMTTQLNKHDLMIDADLQMSLGAILIC
jgi:hypothetical protein